MLTHARNGLQRQQVVRIAAAADAELQRIIELRIGGAQPVNDGTDSARHGKLQDPHARVFVERRQVGRHQTERSYRHHLNHTKLGQSFLHISSIVFQLHSQFGRTECAKNSEALKILLLEKRSKNLKTIEGTSHLM